MFLYIQLVPLLSFSVSLWNLLPFWVVALVWVCLLSQKSSVHCKCSAGVLVIGVKTREIEAGSDPRGHLGVTWGVYLCAGKPPSADIILSHPPDLTRCDSVIGLAIPAMSGHIQYRGAASWNLYIRISGINRVLLSLCSRNFSAFRSDGQCIGDRQLARDFALTDWLTVISRYFGGNPDEGSDFISKGFVASAIF